MKRERELYCVSLVKPGPLLLEGSRREYVAVKTTLRAAKTLQRKVPGCTIFALSFRRVAEPL